MFYNSAYVSILGRKEIAECPWGMPHGGRGQYIARQIQSAEEKSMPDKFDPYREALVMETITVWPDEYEELETAEKDRIAQALHSDPENCADLAYFRTHTGFCRQITVTEDDVDRVG